MTVRVGINGFGRMGRALLRASLQRDLGIDVVAVNELGSLPTMVGLLRRDTVYGRLDRQVVVTDGGFEVDKAAVRWSSEKDPAAIDWDGVDVVVESTGHFHTRDAAAAHLRPGVKRVVVSAPCSDADLTVVLGVNDDQLDPGRHQVISNASCTTNCLAPMMKVLSESFGVEQGLITTIHAYTGDQNLVDGPHKDPRRARAAALNIVPTSTGAARATGLVLPAMKGRLDGKAVRVPVADGSLTDLVALVSRPVTVEEINQAFAAAAAGPLAGIIEYSDEPLVSSDIVGADASCVFDSELTMASDRLVKVFGWYDNEWGYANRLGQVAALAGRD
ncbi:type I glyceraldehyde-3-phosphate dehydrogenase [Acidiferrimicrobium sp. IK]|uniref:type I glyceraldehyde-3-phosphate dehydrogenase n=1 Tax=Acidiferrimicrobium sp. IK TaxID=2871700 RepID=UPI0021CB6FCF|nr:type I glyceraldehyde-3-phosphate dehydrogenase [Acidiferrimicrobium sp. IK]MCU4182878.1 type I glyceraldehyde-3-phosphate dehydrogenase [Acidiferrimicrobium sp. IK]